MIFTNAKVSDIPQLKKMWKNIFKDESSYIELFFEYKMKPEYTFVAKENDDIAGVVYSVYSPLLLDTGETVSALYMCGICTKPKYRGRNIASTLIKNCLEFAKSINVDLCYLIPANIGLFDFYKKLGFETITYMDKIEVGTKRDTLPSYKEGYRKEILNYYGKLVMPFKPQRNEKDFIYISKSYSNIIEFDEGYVVIDEDDECVFLMEQSFEGTEYAKIYAGNMNKKLIIYIPTDDKGTPFCVANKINPNVSLPRFGYINLMLN